MTTPRNATHTEFVIERSLKATPQAVYDAWADAEAKRRWSDCHPEHTTHYMLDLRPLGRESHHVRYPDGKLQVIEKVFFDVVPAKRLVFAYDISLDGRRLSVSLVTVEFLPEGVGTRMVYAEQLAYLDGHEDLAERRRGTEGALDRLALALHAGAAPH